MKLCMTLLVRDEASTVRENIEYHLSRGVDFIIATDNLSTDGTADILKSYEKQGCLRYIFEHSDDYSQDLWVTRMARMAFDEYQADWVIHVDADEFWWTEKRDLKSIFHQCPPDTDGLSVARTNFLTPHNYESSTSLFKQMIVRQVKSTNPLGMPLPPKSCHRGFRDITIRQGNHGFNLPDRQAKISACTEAIIFHFPMRDYDSFQHTVVIGGAAYERNLRLDKRIGNTWRRLYEMHQAGELGNYYRNHVFDASQLESHIEQGEAVYDVRLRDYMETLFSEGQHNSNIGI